MLKISSFSTFLTVIIIITTVWGNISYPSIILFQSSTITQGTSQSLVPHDRIVIDSNEDFINYSFTGSGTSNDPFIIEGYNITSSDGNMISISGTTDYFIIRKNHLDGLRSAWGGIVFTDVENGRIENNTIINFVSQAIFLVFDSQNNIIINNTLDRNNNGIIIRDDGNFNTISNNTITRNLHIGIQLDAGSSSNTVHFNEISKCINYAFLMGVNCRDNIVKRNDFLQNTRVSGSTIVDIGSNNSFTYNHWDDWTTPDANNDGIVDIPYEFNGASNNADYFPLVKPTTIVSIQTSTTKDLKGSNFQFPVDLRLIVAIIIFTVVIGVLGFTIGKKRKWI